MFYQATRDLRREYEAAMREHGKQLPEPVFTAKELNILDLYAAGARSEQERARVRNILEKAELGGHVSRAQTPSQYSRESVSPTRNEERGMTGIVDKTIPPERTDSPQLAFDDDFESDALDRDRLSGEMERYAHIERDVEQDFSRQALQQEAAKHAPHDARQSNDAKASRESVAVVESRQRDERDLQPTREAQRGTITRDAYPGR